MRFFTYILPFILTPSTLALHCVSCEDTLTDPPHPGHTHPISPHEDCALNALTANYEATCFDLFGATCDGDLRATMNTLNPVEMKEIREKRIGEERKEIIAQGLGKIFECHQCGHLLEESEGNTGTKEAIEFCTKCKAPHCTYCRDDQHAP
jgi:hypothetical protein